MNARSVAATAVLLAAGCNDWRDAYDFAWHGEHVTVYSYGYTEEDVCGGSLSELDQHSAAIADDLGIPIVPFVYRWISDDARSQLDHDPCGDPASECATASGAISSSLPFMHEAVHMIAGLGECPMLLDEGMATYYSGPLRLAPSRDRLPVGDDLRRLFDGGTVIGHYIEAMHFVSYLAETYGPPAIAALCEALPYEPNRAQWDTAMREVVGVSLDQLLADYDAYPQCTYSQMRAKLWGCKRPADILLYAKGTYLIESDCGDPQATNANGGPGDATLRRLIFVPNRTVVDVVAWSEPPRHGPQASYMITQCTACSESPDVHVPAVPDSDVPGHNNWHVLEPGYHEVAVFFDRRDRVTLRINVFAVHDE